MKDEEKRLRGRPRVGDDIEGALWSKIDGIPRTHLLNEEGKWIPVEGARDEKGNPFPSSNCWLIRQEPKQAWPGGPARLYPEGTPRGDFTAVFKGIRKSIQRHAWEAMNGPIFGDRRLYMACHNGKKCCNPSHAQVKEKPVRRKMTQEEPIPTKYDQKPHKFNRRPDLR